MARILLAEDEPGQCAELLKKLRVDHEVIHVDNAADAIKHLQQATAEGQPFNIVLTDGVLKGSLGGGGDIIAAMRYKLPEYGLTPVIACSSNPKMWSGFLEYKATAANLYPINKLAGWDTPSVTAKVRELFPT